MIFKYDLDILDTDLESTNSTETEVMPSTIVASTGKFPSNGRKKIDSRWKVKISFFILQDPEYRKIFKHDVSIRNCMVISRHINETKNLYLYDYIV